MIREQRAAHNERERRLRELRDEVIGKPGWTYSDAKVRWAIATIERFELDRVELWRRDGHKAPGGRPAKTTTMAVLVAMLLAAQRNDPQLITVYLDTLCLHISPAMRAELGFAEPPEEWDRQWWQNAYQSLRRRFLAIIETMDPSELPKNQRLTPEEFAAAIKPLTDAERDLRYDRLTWFANQILEVSIQSLPRDVRRQWKGDVGLDATKIDAYSDFDHSTYETVNGKRVKTGVITHASDPDAGVYRRDADNRIPGAPGSVPGRTIKKVAYAYEASIVMMGAVAESDEDGAVPNLAVGMAPLHRPGVEPGRNGITALNSVRCRHDERGAVAADRAYTNEKAENFAHALRALGFQPVLDYRKDQVGQQGSYEGAGRVDGTFYCPAMPQRLVEASTLWINGEITDDELDVLLDARVAFAFRPNGKPNADGSQRMMCPAAHQAPTVRCDHKPESIKRKHAGKRRVDLNHLLRDNPPLVCSQQTVTFTLEAFGKYDQPYPWRSKEWFRRYTILRNGIEGVNGHGKDGTGPMIDEPSRRRVRGVAAQTVFVALGLFSMNMQRIVSFMKRAVVGADGVFRTRDKERARVGRLTLEDFRPPPVSGAPPSAA